jgi:mRNA-degrading endonuclease RelE of RelBE toxin-antitoxin system
MENKIINEQNPTDFKTVISIRCFSELKHHLTLKAYELGMTLSEYCVYLLNHTIIISDENKNLKNEIIDEKTKLLEYIDQFEIQKNINNKKLIELNMTIKELLHENKKLHKFKELLDCPKIESLYNLVKNKKDTYTLKDGSFRVVYYNSKFDLIKAMIDSFEYKKP